MSLSGGVNDLAARIAEEIKSLRSTTPRRHYAAVTADSTVVTIEHNLGSRDVTVQMFWDEAPYESFWATVRRVTVNTVEIHFAEPPNADIRVIVQGG